MLERVIEFTDYDGNKRKESHYFNMNEAEVIKWITTTGEYTLDKVILRLSQERNGKKIMEIFDGLIELSYGRKSLDGRKFEKSKEIYEDFSQTEAYSKLFVELVTDAKKAADFINSIIPQDLAESVSKIMIENKDGLPAEIIDYIPKQPEETN